MGTSDFQINWDYYSQCFQLAWPIIILKFWHDVHFIILIYIIPGYWLLCFLYQFELLAGLNFQDILKNLLKYAQHFWPRLNILIVGINRFIVKLTEITLSYNVYSEVSKFHPLNLISSGKKKWSFYLTVTALLESQMLIMKSFNEIAL